MATTADKKVAIITGSSSGIGLDVARYLHESNYNVALSARRTDVGKAEAVALDPTGSSAIFVACDASSYDSQKKLFQAVWDKWGRIDVFIANAGRVDGDSKYSLARRDNPLADVPPEPDTTSTDLNFKGAIYGITLSTHFMRHNPTPGGNIIITGSMSGVHPCPTFPEYCGSKAAIHQYVRAIAPMLIQDKITVNTVSPGAYDTPAMPDFSVAFLPEHLCIKSCLLSAYDRYLDNASRTGELIEVAHDKLYIYEVPEFKGGDVSIRNSLVYEPWFTLMHGSKSGISGALQGKMEH